MPPESVWGFSIESASENAGESSLVGDVLADDDDEGGGGRNGFE